MSDAGQAPVAETDAATSTAAVSHPLPSTGDGRLGDDMDPGAGPYPPRVGPPLPGTRLPGTRGPTFSAPLLIADTEADPRSIQVSFDNAKLWRTALMLAALLVLVRLLTWAFGRVDELLLTLLLAWLGAISMEPIIRYLGRRGWRRGTSAGVVMITGFAMAVAFLAAFGGAFFSQMADLATAIPSLTEDFIDWANRTFGLTFDPSVLANTLNSNTREIATIATNLAGGFVGILGTLAKWVFQLAAMALFAFYFAADGPRIKRAIGGRLAPPQQQAFVRMWDTTVSKTGGYVISKALLALISTLSHALAFFVLDVPYWLPMALWVGVTSQFLPVIGTYLGVALPILATVFTEPWHALGIVIFATAYQQLENYVLVPRLSRRTMDIHPAVAFLAVVVGVQLFGWIGGIVAIPLTAAGISISSSYGQRYELIPQLALPDHPHRQGPPSDPTE